MLRIRVFAKIDDQSIGTSVSTKGTHFHVKLGEFEAEAIFFFLLAPKDYLKNVFFQ